jgi:hypothetical protein
MAFKSLKLHCAYICLYGNKIGPALTTSSLDELDLGDNLLNVRSVGLISDTLRTISSLKSLAVGIHDWFFYKDPGHTLLAFGVALEHNQTLEKLLRQAAIGEGPKLRADEWNHFFHSLNQNQTLKELTFGFESCVYSGRMRGISATNTSLKKLSISVK